MTHEEYRKDMTYAAEVIFNEYYAYIYTVVRSRLICCASKEDIEECISDIFADIYIYLDEHKDNSGDLTGIISVIAKRKAIYYYYKLTRRPLNTEELSPEETADDDIEQNYEQKEQRRKLISLIKQLGEPDSTIIIQKYFFGYKSGETAKLLGLSSVAVRVRCSRALKRLKKMLTNSEQGGGIYEN